MLLTKEQIERIKRVIEKNYARFLLEISGEATLTDEQLKLLKDSGIDTSSYQESLLQLLYFNHYLNQVDGKNKTPTSEEQLRAQQTASITEPYHLRIIEHLNENLANYINKIKANTVSKFEETIRAANLNYLHQTLSEEDIGKIFKEDSISKIKQKLRDTTGDLSKDWKRVAVTEISNAISLGGIDRVISTNEDKDLSDVYVYRLIVPDGNSCNKCKEFFQDYDGTPVVYRLSTLLANGSNVGRKQMEWLPGTGAVHPNERCSSILELRPGWKVGVSGNLSYIGRDEWYGYIKEKVRG